MGEAFIVRKGGGAGKQTLAPTITEISTTPDSLTFTLTNNDETTATIYYDIDDSVTSVSEDKVIVGAGQTSSNITITGLAGNTTYVVHAISSTFTKIESNETVLSITTAVPIVYTSASGGSISTYTTGGTRYRVHTFTGNGTFTVNTLGDEDGDRNKIEYVIVAGGGGSPAIPGSGAGGYISSVQCEMSGGGTTALPKYTVAAQSYSIVVGAGGAGGIKINGANTSAFGHTAIGGGGSDTREYSNAPGSPGGSGGGAMIGWNNSGPGGAGTAGQGYKGGDGTTVSRRGGGGAGGGAGGPGGNSGNGVAGSGGNGVQSFITGSGVYRAGGGRGSCANTYQGCSFQVLGTDGLGRGAANLGGGGRALQDFSEGTCTPLANPGDSGVVIVRYEIAP